MCKFRIIERNKNGRIFYIVERKTWLGWSSIKGADDFYDMEFPYLANAKDLKNIITQKLKIK